jgi:enoyl-CoA hydratase/carnithine racemase
VTHVALSIDRHVATIRLQRPAKRNALTASMVDQTREHLVAAAAHDSVRLLVVAGDGPAFCAGVDVTDTGVSDLPVLLEALLAAVESFPVPSVAVIQGPCIGAGCAIALACDVRLSSTEASFGIPVARFGLRYPDRSVARLVELVGTGRAGLLLYAGQTIDARTAAAWALVDSCTDDLASAVDEFADGVGRGNADSIQFCRRQIRAAGKVESAGE